LNDTISSSSAPAKPALSERRESTGSSPPDAPAPASQTPAVRSDGPPPAQRLRGMRTKDEVRVLIASRGNQNIATLPNQHTGVCGPADQPIFNELHP
jgi:hypothetical protein